MLLTMIRFALALLLLLAPVAFAKPHGSHRHHSGAKTVHVHSYTKKNGQHVKSYNRTPPHPTS
jgi:hypothetical protein